LTNEGASIAEFQRGESGEGRHLIRYAREYAERIGDPDYAPAIVFSFARSSDTPVIYAACSSCTGFRWHARVSPMLPCPDAVPHDDDRPVEPVRRDKRRRLACAPARTAFRWIPLSTILDGGVALLRRGVRDQRYR
jgi:hypothetical protein